MVRVLFEGKEACFTRPELKVERVSYDVPTPSAIRGMLEAIYWHPGMSWKVNKIYIMNPIKMYTVKRNEVEDKASKNKKYIDVSLCRQQRSSRILKDVCYVVDATFNITKDACTSDNAGKFQSIITRRILKGQCFNTPYLGNREFPAVFKPFDGNEIHAEDINIDMGLMFYDFDYSNDDVIPSYFHCKVEHGVIDLTNVEILK